MVNTILVRWREKNKKKERKFSSEKEARRFIDRKIKRGEFDKRSLEVFNEVII